MSKFFYSSVLAFVCSPAAWAGPSTSAMVLTDAAAPRAADIASAPPASSLDATRLSEDSPVSLADATDIGPADPHPMIPLPPALWAGFAGLAYVARRVTRRRA